MSSFFKLILIILVLLGGHDNLDADQISLEKCMVSNGVELPNESILICASNAIATLTVPRIDEVIKKYDPNGRILLQTNRQLIVKVDKNNQLIDESDKKQILKTVADSMSDAEFNSLPALRQAEIFKIIESSVHGYPTYVPGQSLTDDDRRAKLKDLNMKLRIVKASPVLAYENAHSLAEQMSKLANRVGIMMLQRINQNLETNSDMVAAVSTLLEDDFCREARDTMAPTFKRVLSPDKMEQLESVIQESIRNISSDFDPILLDDIKKSHLANQNEDRVDLDASIAMRLVTSFKVSVFMPIRIAYYNVAKSSGLIPTNLHPGISDEEISEHSQEMSAVFEREMYRRSNYTAATTIKFFKDAELRGIELQKKFPRKVPAKKLEDHPLVLWLLVSINFVAVTAFIAFTIINRRRKC